MLIECDMPGVRHTFLDAMYQTFYFHWFLKRSISQIRKTVPQIQLLTIHYFIPQF